MNNYLKIHAQLYRHVFARVSHQSLNKTKNSIYIHIINQLGSSFVCYIFKKWYISAKLNKHNLYF